MSDTYVSAKLRSPTNTVGSLDEVYLNMFGFRSTRILLCVVLLLAFTALAAAQTGLIQGTLLDATGASVPNAKVSAIDEGKNIVARETATGSDGSFRLVQLLRGTYTVKVEGPGFKALERTGLVLDPNQVMDLGQLRLEVGQ